MKYALTISVTAEALEAPSESERQACSLELCSVT